MKKNVALLCLLLACSPSWCLDWQLPIFSARYEAATGQTEDPDEETLLPSSLRQTVALHIREEAAPALFGLTLTYSLKDYYLQSGDYSYVSLAQDGSVRMGIVRLAYDVSAKSVSYPLPDSDGLSKDLVSLRAATGATFTIVRGTNLEATVTGRFDLAENDAKSQQAYIGALALTSRLGDWQVGGRIRGEIRMPLGEASLKDQATYATGSLTASWDPN